jgi:hypothetical protein
MNKIRHVILGTSLVVGTAVGSVVTFAYSDTKPAASATKLKKPATTTTNRMQKRPPAVKPAGGTQLEYEKPTGAGGAGGAKVNSTLTQKGTIGAGNNKNSKSNGNTKFKQNTVNKAGYQSGSTGGDDTPTEKRSATGGAGAGAKSTAPAKTTSPIKQ